MKDQKLGFLFKQRFRELPEKRQTLSPEIAAILGSRAQVISTHSVLIRRFIVF